MTHLPLFSWCRHCIKGRDCRKSVEEERHVPEIHLDYMFMGDEKEGESLAFFGDKRTGDERCAQHRGSKEIDGRMDLPKADGMAA